MEFKQWLLLNEIGQVPSPDKPELPPCTAFPSYSLDGNDKPPTSNSNRTRRLMLDRRRRMKKK
jgi:hypothetical protein